MNYKINAIVSKSPAPDCFPFSTFPNNSGTNERIPCNYINIMHYINIMQLRQNT